MGTRNHPGRFDVTPAKVKPGEPYFILHGSDILAADLVELWAIKAKSLGCHHDKTREAMQLAEEMREFPHYAPTTLYTELRHCAPDEPHFVLRGQDSLAADIVETWAKRARELGWSGLARQAIEVAGRMYFYSGHKNPD